jgi:hypothetical protein
MPANTGGEAARTLAIDEYAMRSADRTGRLILLDLTLEFQPVKRRTRTAIVLVSPTAGHGGIARANQ